MDSLIKIVLDRASVYLKFYHKFVSTNIHSAVTHCSGCYTHLHLTTRESFCAMWAKLTVDGETNHEPMPAVPVSFSALTKRATISLIKLTWHQ